LSPPEVQCFRKGQKREGRISRKTNHDYGLSKTLWDFSSLCGVLPYFGQHKGVSVYSFIDERHFLFHSTVISSAEREAAYVIDGLLHNEVVKSDIHSTDTHGYGEIIFGATFLLGFSFAPI
jgi:TnpA family transposase